MDHRNKDQENDTRVYYPKKYDPNVIQDVMGQLADHFAEVWHNAIEDLRDGIAPGNRYRNWVPVVFVLLRGPLTKEKWHDDFEMYSFWECINLLTHEEWGWRIGYVMQILGNMDADAIKRLRASLKVHDRVWIVGWLQLFDRVLGLYGVERDEEARNVCKKVLSKMRKRDSPEVPWNNNEMIVETAGQADMHLGEKKDDRDRLLPGWTPKVPEPISWFHAGMIASQKDGEKEGKKKGKSKDGPYIEEPGGAKKKTRKKAESEDGPYIEEPEGAKKKTWTPPVTGRHVKDEYRDAERERLRQRFEF